MKRVMMCLRLALIGIFHFVFSIATASAAIPNPPSGLSATTLGATKIQLSWTDNSTDETSFYIERKIGPTGTYSSIGSVQAGIAAYTNTGLTQNTEYYYRVRAYNSSGYSAYTNEASAVTQPLGAPSNLVISSVSYTQAVLSWTDNSDEETGFKVERRTGIDGTYTQVGTTGANVTTLTNSGLTQGTEYYYRVRSYIGTNNSEYSNEAAATTLKVNAPSGLTASPLSATQMSLSWTDNSGDEQGFRIERKTGASGTYSHIASVGANITTYSNSSLVQNTEYYYRLRAYNGSNNSDYSNEANAVTLHLNAPTNLSASGVSYAQLTLTWSDNSIEETGFEIERKTGAGGTYARVSTTAANATTYTNASLVQGTEYYFRIRAVSGSNYSQYSNEIAVTTLMVNAPSGLAASATGATAIQLNWTDNSSDEQGFRIERKTGAGGAYSTIYTTSANATMIAA